MGAEGAGWAMVNGSNLYGFARAEEFRQLVEDRLNMRRMTIDTEHILAIAEAHWPHSPVTRKKISEAQKRRWERQRAVEALIALGER